MNLGINQNPLSPVIHSSQHFFSRSKRVSVSQGLKQNIKYNYIIYYLFIHLSLQHLSLKDTMMLLIYNYDY